MILLLNFEPSDPLNNIGNESPPKISYMLLVGLAKRWNALLMT